MIRRRKWTGSRIIILCGILLGAVACESSAATAPQLATALRQIESPQLDEASAINISNLTLEQPNFTLTLSKGVFYFFKPLQLDTASLVYGGFFFGSGDLRFSPPIQMERDQLKRFYGKESLRNRCEDVMLVFTSKTLEQIRQAGTPAQPLGKKAEGQLQDRFGAFTKYLNIREDHSFAFAALRSLAFPRKQPYLLANANLEGDEQIFYMFDPYEREEVQFYRYFKQFVVPFFMEKICSYSVYADSTYAMLNGTDKSPVKPLQYTIDASLSPDGNLTARTDMSVQAQIQPVQMLSLMLHERLVVDSIRDSLARPVEFVRWQKEHNRNKQLLVFLPEPLLFGQQTRLTFYYHGDPIQQRVGEMYVNAGDTWYPVCNQGYNEGCRFNMSFRSPVRYGFVASGRLLDQKQAGDTLLTTWQTDSTAFDVSFNIGTFTRFEFTLEDLPTVDVYYLERLHRDSTQKIQAAIGGGAGKEEDRSSRMRDVATGGKNMQEQVASDVIGALQTFSQRFGPLSLERIAASEVLDSTRYGFFGQRFGNRSLPGMRASTGTPKDEEFSAENIGVPEDTSLEKLFKQEPTNEGYRGPLFPGQSFTNLLMLRFDTFQKTDEFGEETRYRANGVASQWWQHSMSPETYHDDWLSAGLSEYSALLYLQAASGNNDRFLYWLGQYRQDLLSGTSFLLQDRQPVGALALGPRAATTESRDDYEILVYRKGAFVFHMLRNMLLNLETLDESRFFTLLRDFYTTFKGRRVNTEEFRALTERHTGIDMKWFFDQWVYGTAIPRYKFSYKVVEAEGKGYKARIRIEQKDVPATFRAYLPIEIQFDSGDRAYARVLVDQPTIEQELTFESRPKKLRLNPFESVLARVDQ